MIHTLLSLTQDLSHWPHSNAPWVVICLERTPLWPNDLFTYFAFETSFTCMNILMLSKGMCIFERFTTCVSRDWLLLRMNSNVILQLEFFHKSFASVLTGKWSFPRMILFLNDLLHCLNENNLFPVWTTLCIFRIWLVLKYCSQKRQTNSDFCFVWTLIWCFNCPASRKVLFQCWQEKCFSPEWCFSCLPRVPACVNDLLQYLYVNDLVPVCTTLYLSRPCLVLKSFPQMMHAIRIFDITGFSLISMLPPSIAIVALYE